MTRRFFFLIAVLTLSVPLFADGYIFTASGAKSETDRVILSWATASEEKVATFIILRGRDKDACTEIHRLNALGPGTQYSYVDREVMFRSVHVMYYKIRAVDANGNIMEEADLSVIPNVSGMFRTWGTIKAMFR